jgi:hypothetical protein
VREQREDNNSVVTIKERMDGEPFLVDIRMNTMDYTEALIDSGCLCYASIDDKLCSKLKLPRIPITPHRLEGVTGTTPSKINWISHANVDIAGHRQKLYFYVVPDQAHPLILGLPWMEEEHVTLSPAKRRLHIGTSGVRVWSKRHQPETKGTTEAKNAKLIIGSVFMGYIRRARKKQNQGFQIFTTSLADIEKALAKKKFTDPSTKLPKELHKHLTLFNEVAANTLPPYRPGIDHQITLRKDETGKEMEIPWGPLYSMSQEELLVLRKTLIDYLDKGFIRVSSSPAGAPVLFVKKPGGGLCFCVDYRALNARSRQDRYPLPLVRETLRMLSRAKWFTKIDIAAAFHKIRIAEGDEWKTAFRTHYGLFEWLVTPFHPQIGKLDNSPDLSAK